MKKYYNSKNETFTIDYLDNKNINFIISEENKKYKIGVCNTEFLKMLLYYGVIKSRELEGDILYQDIFQWDFRKTFILHSDELCYIYLIITTNEIIAYELDNYFRIMKVKRNILKKVRPIVFNQYSYSGKRIQFTFDENEEYYTVSFNCIGKKYDEIFKILKSLNLDVVSKCKK